MVRTFENDDAVTDSTVFIDLSSRITSGGETRPARHGVPSQLPDRSARLSLLHRHGCHARPGRSRLANSARTTTAPRSPRRAKSCCSTSIEPERQSQRRQHRLRPGRLPLHRHRRRRRRRRSARHHRQRPAADHAARQDAAHRRRRHGGARPTTPSPRPTRSPANARCGAGGTGADECPEIFAYGFRNPWRWSFDRGSGELWLNDVGQSAWEEIDNVTRGGNYGWRCFEGAHDFNSSLRAGRPNPIDPVAHYGRTAGFSATGGFVYRGSAIDGLARPLRVRRFWRAHLACRARTTAPTLQVTAADGFDTGLQISIFRAGQRRRAVRGGSRRYAAARGAAVVRAFFFPRIAARPRRW